MPRYTRDQSGNIAQDYTGIDLLPLQGGDRSLAMQRQGAGLDAFGFPTQTTANRQANAVSAAYAGINEQRDQTYSRIYGQPVTAADIPKFISAGLPLDQDNLGSSQFQRAAQIQGGAELFRKIADMNPNAGVSEMPAIASGAEGGVARLMKGTKLAGNNYNDTIADHPAFISLLKTHPERAAAFYESVTGRSYEGDVKAKQSAMQEVQDFQKTEGKKLAMEVVKAPKDDLTNNIHKGDLVRMIPKVDTTGAGPSYAYVPLTTGQQELWDTPGAIHQATGIKTDADRKREAVTAMELVQNKAKRGVGKEKEKARIALSMMEADKMGVPTVPLPKKEGIGAKIAHFFTGGGAENMIDQTNYNLMAPFATAPGQSTNWATSGEDARKKMGYSVSQLPSWVYGGLVTQPNAEDEARRQQLLAASMGVGM